MVIVILVIQRTSVSNVSFAFINWNNRGHLRQIIHLLKFEDVLLNLPQGENSDLPVNIAIDNLLDKWHIDEENCLEIFGCPLFDVYDRLSDIYMKNRTLFDNIEISGLNEINIEILQSQVSPLELSIWFICICITKKLK